MNPIVLQGASIFGAGLLTSLTPCVYPMIPITLGYLGSRSAKNNKRSIVFGYFVGQVLAFTLLGVTAVTLGEIFGFSSEIPSVQIGTGIFLLVFAYFSWKGELPGVLSRLNHKLNSIESRNLNVFGAALVGALSAIIASPCASPILGGVLATIAQSGNILVGAGLMFLYALGISLIFLILGLGLVSAGNIPRSGRWLSRIHRASTALLGALGAYYVLLGTGVL